MDAPDAVGSITAPNMNEFYLNAHAAILGTSKPCKYDLIYDEIGLEVSSPCFLSFLAYHLRPFLMSSFSPLVIFLF
jgi:hypothetical protein